MPYWSIYKRSQGAPGEIGEWDIVSDPDRADLVRSLPELLRTLVLPPNEVLPRVAKLPLSFCPNHALYEFVRTDVLPALPLYLVQGHSGTHVLDWSNTTPYAMGEAGLYAFDERTVIDYVRFFFSHVIGRYARFVLLESADVLRQDESSEEDEQLLLSLALPLEPEAVKRENDHFIIEAHVLLKDSLAEASISVDGTGKIEINFKGLLHDDLPVIPDSSTDRYYPGKPTLDFVDGWHVLSSLKDADRERLLKSVNVHYPLRDDQECWQRLPFFKGVTLVRLDEQKESTDFGAYALLSERGVFPLTGSSGEIYDAIERETFELNDRNVVDYLHFFCHFTHTQSEGPFRAVTRLEDMNYERAPRGSDKPDVFEECPVAFDQLSWNTLEFLLTPTVSRHDADEGTWHCSTLSQYGDTLFHVVFKVMPSGEPEMIHDQIVVTDIPFDREKNRIQNWSIQGEEITKWTARVSVPPPPPKDPSEEYGPKYLNARRLEHSILQEYVRQLLLRALREQQATPLFEFDPEADDSELIKQFAKFVYSRYPVILIESSIPYIEEMVALLLGEKAGGWVMPKKLESSWQGESAGVVPDIEDGDTLTLSLHQWHRILRPEAAAYRLGVTDTATYIGCDTPAVVPDALYRVVDISLRLDAIDPELFEALFRQLLDCEFPDSSKDDVLWQRYVGPGDFYLPVRDMLRRRYVSPPAVSDWSPEHALAMIRERVKKRLSVIDVSDAPGLDELHGLGEAKAILQDLLSDVRAAVSGAIGWESVDRGLLLVGDPGVGKTMLARALARDAGLRFIHASGAGWIAGTDDLSAHILAIRATFAEARRNTPCILFIDELDSIGNRQHFEGRNLAYSTEIVNVLLQELQGVIDRQGVFVIGATNYLSEIDPALTRAGRLDQVVHIPRPDHPALQAILRFHLEPYRREDRLGDDIDIPTLAGLALGSSGADIEFFVRDAARRARKESTTIQHRHLAAAITRTPRNQHGVRRVTPEEQKRTAIHEAGHAIALLGCRHYPARLSMVSIIPRSDGSLGFTGSLPDARQVLTRQACEEYLQVLLAGRAAEELHYGRDGVSSGAGGPSEHSDLALATRWAAQMACQLGFGADGELQWRAAAGKARDAEQIRILLDSAYQTVKKRLAEHHRLLNALSEGLLKSHELHAETLQHLAKTHGLHSEPQPPAGGGEHVPAS